MITKTTTRRSAWARQTTACILLAGSLFLFSNAGNARDQATSNAPHPERLVDGSEKPGAHPFVLINGKEYAPDIPSKYTVVFYFSIDPNERDGVIASR